MVTLGASRRMDGHHGELRGHVPEHPPFSKQGMCPYAFARADPGDIELFH
jgi:hypothetical protein